MVISIHAILFRIPNPLGGSQDEVERKGAYTRASQPIYYYLCMSLSRWQLSCLRDRRKRLLPVKIDNHIHIPMKSTMLQLKVNKTYSVCQYVSKNTTLLHFVTVFTLFTQQSNRQTDSNFHVIFYYHFTFVSSISPKSQQIKQKMGRHMGRYYVHINILPLRLPGGQKSRITKGGGCG